MRDMGCGPENDSEAFSGPNSIATVSDQMTTTPTDEPSAESHISGPALSDAMPPPNVHSSLFAFFSLVSLTISNIPNGQIVTAVHKG